MGAAERTLTADEISQFFNHMSEFFPRMNTSAAVVELWHDSLKKYRLSDLHLAFKRYVQTKDRQPALADMIELCRAITGPILLEEIVIESRGNMIRESRGAWRPKTKMEIVLDAFGDDFVKDAIAEAIVALGADVKSFRYSDLFRNKKWVEPYLRRLEELYLLARQTKNAPECIDYRDIQVSQRLAQDPDFVTF